MKSLILLLVLVAFGTTKFLGQLRADVICESQEAYNAEELLAIRKCTIIEGRLFVAVVEDVEDWSNYSLTNLTQVTEYVTIFRNANLQSLSMILPNLMVIRGEQLMKKYALIIHGNMHLLEVGLENLAVISRGAVLIDKNWQLCRSPEFQKARFSALQAQSYTQDNSVGM
ncbi:unnamed protein product, partial [Meganyctiphanes norvegica]